MANLYEEEIKKHILDGEHAYYRNGEKQHIVTESVESSSENERL